MQLEANGLRVERGGRIVLADVSFILDAGEALVVTGANGTGKSTLLRALAGLLPLTAGHIAASPQGTEDLSETMHYVGHADALKAALTVAENLAFWSALLGPPAREDAVDAALATLGLAHTKNFPAATLSAGQRRRAALARLLVAPRPIWLLDEPTTSLDAESEATLSGLMSRHLQSGGMIVAATHARLGIEGRQLRLDAAS